MNWSLCAVRGVLDNSVWPVIVWFANGCVAYNSVDQIYKIPMIQAVSMPSCINSGHWPMWCSLKHSPPGWYSIYTGTHNWDLDCIPNLIGTKLLATAKTKADMSESGSTWKKAPSTPLPKCEMDISLVSRILVWKPLANIHKPVTQRAYIIAARLWLWTASQCHVPVGCSPGPMCESRKNKAKPDVLSEFRE